MPWHGRSFEAIRQGFMEMLNGLATCESVRETAGKTTGQTMGHLGYFFGTCNQYHEILMGF
jgi:hypothetical protein